MSENIERDGISRRTVVRGAAWAAPVIAVAVATPLAAASGDGTINWGDPAENGVGGNMAWSAASSAVNGNQYGYYTVDVQGDTQTPPLTATFTASGAWTYPVRFSATNGGAPLTVGQSLTGTLGSPIVWTVVSVTGDTVVVAAAAQTAADGTALLASPRIYATSAGDAVGGTAGLGIVLTGGPTGDVTNTSTTTVPAV